MRCISPIGQAIIFTMTTNESSDERRASRRNKILGKEMVLKGFAGPKLSKEVYMDENLMNLQVQCRLKNRKQTIYCR